MTLLYTLALAAQIGAVLIAALPQRLRIFARGEAYPVSTPAGAGDMALIPSIWTHATLSWFCSR